MSVARGYPETPGIPSELETLAWMVGGFWVLVGAILFALWWARRLRAARPEREALAEHDRREHLAWLDRLREDDEQPTLDLPGVVWMGKHRRD